MASQKKDSILIQELNGGTDPMGYFDDELYRQSTKDLSLPPFPPYFADQIQIQERLAAMGSMRKETLQGSGIQEFDGQAQETGHTDTLFPQLDPVQSAEEGDGLAPAPGPYAQGDPPAADAPQQTAVPPLLHHPRTRSAYSGTCLGLECKKTFSYQQALVTHMEHAHKEEEIFPPTECVTHMDIPLQGYKGSIDHFLSKSSHAVLSRDEYRHIRAASSEWFYRNNNKILNPGHPDNRAA